MTGLLLRMNRPVIVKHEPYRFPAPNSALIKRDTNDSQRAEVDLPALFVVRNGNG